MLLERRNRGLRKRVLLGEQDSVAGARRPRRRWHGEGSFLRGREHHVLGGLARGLGAEAVDLRGELERVGAGDDRVLAAVGAGHGVADPDHLCAVGRRRPGRVEARERAGGDRGHLIALGEEDRRADRVGGEHGCRDPALPVVLVDEGHRVGAVVVARRGEDRGRHAGRVFGRVPACHPDGVRGSRVGEGRRRRIARRLRVVTGSLEDQLRGVTLLLGAAPGQRDEREGGTCEEGEQSSRHGG